MSRKRFFWRAQEQSGNLVNSFLRNDSLATILAYANFHGPTNSLILEDTQGFFSSTVAQRCSPKSKNLILNFKKIQRKYNTYLNVKKASKRTLAYVAYEDLVEPKNALAAIVAKQYEESFDK